MEQGHEDLGGLSFAEAKEYIVRYMTTLKLTEKQCAELDAELRKWEGRVELARSRSSPELAEEAQGEADKIKVRRDSLQAEIDGLKKQIEDMRRQLPTLAGRERSVDPDLLEQELLIALGKMPGDEIRSASDRGFAEMEADAALEALKAKMRDDPRESP
jgi:phage shock protein A